MTTPEQREFVEQLLDDWDDADFMVVMERGNSVDERHVREDHTVRRDRWADLVASEPLVVPYVELAATLGRALDHDSPEFWEVVAALDAGFPQFAWHNAMTDG